MPASHKPAQSTKASQASQTSQESQTSQATSKQASHLQAHRASYSSYDQFEAENSSQPEGPWDQRFMDIMGMEVVDLPQLQTMVNSYYKKNMKDLDFFDNLLQQCIMQAMMNENKSLIQSMENFDKLLNDYNRVVNDQSFAASSFIIYLHFSIFFEQDESNKLFISLMRHGADTLFPKLNWIDITSLVDAAVSNKMPFSNNIMLKTALRMLSDDYVTVTTQLQTEPMIKLIEQSH